MLVAYIFVAFVVGLNQMANAEVSTLMPVTGSYVRQSEQFIDEPLGFALGWINIYAAIVPSELAATAVVMSFWTDINSALWISIFGIIIIATNSYSVRFYGEVEFYLGILKILLIIGLFLTCLIIDLGGIEGNERIGFRYWKETPWNEYYSTGSLGRFLAFWKCVSGVVYSYGGIQTISLYGGETEHPRRSIFTAARRIRMYNSKGLIPNQMYPICLILTSLVVRVFTLYFLTIFVLTLVLSSKDSDIVSSTGNAAGSPFVIAIKRAGIKGLPHVINAVVLTSAFSAANLSIIQGSRSLFALASKKQAPSIFLKTNKQGLPYFGVIAVSLFIPLAYMSSSSSSSTVFLWFQNITSSNLLLGWCSISLNHIFLTKAMKKQGYTRNQLPYTFKYAPQAAWISLFFSALILLTSGFSNFLHGNFLISSFFSSYFVIPLFAVLYIFWKCLKRTQLIKPEDVDLASLFANYKDNPEPPLEPLKGLQWLTLLWS